MSYRLISIASAEGTEHENTTTEGSIAKKTFAAGELIAGKIYGFSCGVIVNDNNANDTLTPRVRFGTNATTPTSNTEIAVGAAVDVADGDVSWIRGEIHVHSATRYVFHVTCPDTDAVMTIADKSTVVVFTAVADTAYTLDVTLDWSAAHADNEAAAASFAVWEIV